MSELNHIVCVNCGIEFGVPNSWENERRRSHKGFNCPNGHSLSFNSESKEERFRRQRDRLQQRLAEKDDEIENQRRLTAARKANVTKLKRRAAAGVCPCCNRTFQNLKRHMDGQHPTYVDGPVLTVLTGGKKI